MGGGGGAGAGVTSRFSTASATGKLPNWNVNKLKLTEKVPGALCATGRSATTQVPPFGTDALLKQVDDVVIIEK